MSHNDNTPSKEPEQKSPWYLNFWILSIITLSLWGMTWLTLWLVFTDDNQPNAQAAEVPSWISAGTFGDMFGCLTCLFTGISVAGIIVTLQQQKQALHVQQDELKALNTQTEKQNRLNEKTSIHKLIDGYITFRNTTPITIYTTDENGQVLRESLTHSVFAGRFQESQMRFLCQLLRYAENEETEDELRNSYRQLYSLIHCSSDYQLRLFHLFSEIKNSLLPEYDKGKLFILLSTLVGANDAMLLYHTLAVYIKEEDLEQTCQDWSLEKLRNILYNSLNFNTKESSRLAASTIYVEIAKARKLCIWADKPERGIPETFNLAEWVLEYNKREKIKEQHSATQKAV